MKELGGHLSTHDRRYILKVRDAFSLVFPKLLRMGPFVKRSILQLNRALGHYFDSQGEILCTMRK